MNYAVEISGLTKMFGKFTALADVSLRVAEGETVVILGPSGSGKSTFIRTVAGLESYSQGEMKIVGKIGMVFQNFHLFPHFTVLENIMLAPQRVKRQSKEEAETHARRLMKSFRVEDQADKYPRQLSGGQQQRIAIIRSLAMEPKIMLFDEPTSALDPEAITDVLDVIKGLAGKSMTMMVVTHQMGFAKEVADRVAFFDGGRLLEVAPPEEFFKSPQEARSRLFLSKILRY